MTFSKVRLRDANRIYRPQLATHTSHKAMHDEDNLDTKFEVTGHFYELCGYKFRKYLDIKCSETSKTKPELMVVMMNPGSSYPLDGIDNNSVPSQAVPDKTQYQIMKVMNNVSIDYARVLNLSDLRTPSSVDLYKFLNSEESNLVAHSIFSRSRSADLKNLFITNVPVIYGWGTNIALAPLASLAIKCLRVEKPLGMLKPYTENAYYHPLPRDDGWQREWVQYVTFQLMQAQQRSAPFKLRIHPPRT